MNINYIFIVWVLSLAGCAPADALKPVAVQNQHNLTALAHNVQVLLSIHEALVRSASNTLLFQQVAQTEAELIAVVGPSQLPLKSTNWEQALTQAAHTLIGKRSKILERFHTLQSLLKTNLSPAQEQQLSIKEGWLITALKNKEFTPHKAHNILKKLSELRHNQTQGNNAFYEEAIRHLKVFDPRLEYLENTIEAASILLNALKQELLKEIELAFSYSQAFIRYTQAQVDPQSTLRHFASNVLNELLSRLADNYIENPLLRKAAVSLLMKGADTLTDNLLGN